MSKQSTVKEIFKGRTTHFKVPRSLDRASLAGLAVSATPFTPPASPRRRTMTGRMRNEGPIRYTGAAF